MIKSQLIKRFPNIKESQAEGLANIWEKVLTLIFDEVKRISEPEMTELHVDLREEMILEHAKLRSHIVDKVITAQTEKSNPNKIDLEKEEELCFNVNGLDKISNTGKIIAENIWLRKYHERWKLKTRSALAKEKNPKANKLVIKKVGDNHFIPKSFIRKYWSENGRIRKNNINGTKITSRNIPFSQWGFVKNLYSDKLEAYFGLIEGDASIPLQKLLDFEPLNGPQKKAVIGFIVIQRFRNPKFIDDYNKRLKPIVIDHYGEDKANDLSHQRKIYESLYSNNEAYNKVAQPLNQNQWVIIRSPNSKVLLPDICNILSKTSSGVFFVVPLTYKDCLFVLPSKADEYPFPRHITATNELEEILRSFILYYSEAEFLSYVNYEFKNIDRKSVDEEKLVKLVTELSQREPAI
ncbi:DUF4238 domain-containing protein [Pseudoalteromonas sp. SR44-2]|uniref:DUF4238 domain-containing protein n=1 Tax=Pseudoalteromonas sp. SR44-2 TaxID=2760937 RepID=UPI001603926B|nr:DUF4238 domain-containing protein [Pseudoalteromonas sp. SR44-2]MBB1336626.1 DUF4238 domain-containing protein [Pseudoalteromonas sp. SR44-2]